jgi:hypothetical protein
MPVAAVLDAPLDRLLPMGASAAAKGDSHHDRASLHGDLLRYVHAQNADADTIPK